MVFMDILHEGTKQSLVSGVADDDTVVSFTNTMFTSVYLTTFTCKCCYNSKSSHWMSRMLSVSPAKECSIEQLIAGSMTQIVHKHCACCHKNTEHTETLKWTCPPKYLVLAINRFAYFGNRTIKDNSCIPIQFNVQIHGFKFELVGIIDHHGSTAGSGHYTSTLFHNDSGYHCNDMRITNFPNFKTIDSATAYILVYKLN